MDARPFHYKQLRACSTHFLIIFSFQFYTKLTYMIIVGVLGVATIILVMWEKFSRPEYRTLRAAVFVSLGLLSAIPTIHILVQVMIRLYSGM